MFVPVWIDVVVAFVYAKIRKLDFGKRGFRGKRVSLIFLFIRVKDIERAHPRTQKNKQDRRQKSWIGRAGNVYRGWALFAF